MKLRKIKIVELNIDLAEERQRIVEAGYTEAEQNRLLKVVELFEKGKFKEAFNFASNWGRTELDYPEVEHIHSVIWEVIGGASVGINYEIVNP